MHCVACLFQICLCVCVCEEHARAYEVSVVVCLSPGNSKVFFIRSGICSGYNHKLRFDWTLAWCWSDGGVLPGRCKDVAGMCMILEGRTSIDPVEIISPISCFCTGKAVGRLQAADWYSEGRL